MEEELELNFRLDANGRTAPSLIQAFPKESSDAELAKGDLTTGINNDNCDDFLDYTSKTVLTQLVEPKESLWNDLLLDCEVRVGDMIGID